VPMMPIVGAKPPGLSRRRRALVVAGHHAVDLGLEHLADELRIGAVDDELQALAGEVVLDLGGLAVEGQQTLASRLLGEADELVDSRVEIGSPAARRRSLYSVGMRFIAGMPQLARVTPRRCRR